MSRPVKVVGIGAGGHAKAVLEVIGRTGRYEVVGLLDVDPGKAGTKVMGYPILGTDRELARLHHAGIRRAFMGVGAVSAAGAELRARVFRHAVDLGFEMVTLDDRFRVRRNGRGHDRCGRAVGRERRGVSRRGHDSVIGGHGLVSLGVMIAGGVEVGEGAFLGVGAAVIQRVKIGAWATIGAGAVVLDDVPGGCVAVGVPGRVVGGDKPEPAGGTSKPA